MTVANLAQDVGGWSGPALVLFGLLAFCGTILAIRQSRNDAKRARTLDYMRRLFDLDFAPLITQVLTFLRTGDETTFMPDSTVLPGPSEQPDSTDEARATFRQLGLQWQAKIALVLNFFEELSGSHRAGLLDQRIAKNMLEPAILDAWGAAEWFILDQRAALKWKREKENVCEKTAEREANEVLCEWGSLVKEIKDAPPPPPWWHRLFNDPRWRHSTFLVPVAAILAFAGLVAAASADGPRDVATTFLFMAAGVCLVLAGAALAFFLVRPISLPAAVASAAIACILTAGLTIKLGVDFSLAPQGPQGNPGTEGKAGHEGKPGRDGTVGPEGPAGPRGERGPRGHRGPTGHRGHEGEHGLRGPRGYPGTLQS